MITTRFSKTKWFLAAAILFYGFVFCAPQEEAQIPQATIEVPVEQPAGHSAFQAAIAQFEAEIAADVAEDGVGAISAGVVVGDSVIWANGYGWADIGRNIPADAGTIYRTGSISKSFTAFLMMQMIEDGLFQLDDPVIGYFPEIAQLKEMPENADPITFRQLASHTAGLIREPRLEGAASGPIEKWNEKIMESIPNTYFQSVPGTEYSYSNIGFGILGHVTAHIAGKPFIDLVHARIFDPLGMDRSFFIIPPHLYEHVSMGYSRRRDGTINAVRAAEEHKGRGYKVPNGGIYSTVGDLGKFIAVMTGASDASVISEDTRREMLKRQTPEDGGGYGLGFSISTDDDGFTTMGHGGSVAGYNANMVFDPESQIGVAILRNYSGGRTSLGRAARNLLKELVQAR